MHGYLVTYTEEKLRQYREDEKQLLKLQNNGRTENSPHRNLGTGLWTLLLGTRTKNRRRHDTSMK